MAGKHELEKFEYLFVDIEWNQTPGTNGIEDREPIQIGVVATDESMNLKKSFSGAMRLSSEEKYNPDTLVLSHSTLKSVMQANSEEIVLRKIKMSFPKYKYVVVWTKDTYELFKRGMDTYGYSMPRHRVIVFQEVLMHIASDGVNQIGFERALKQAGIEYQKNFLHYSKHDANYMYHLFCKCYKPDDIKLDKEMKSIFDRISEFRKKKATKKCDAEEDTDIEIDESAVESFDVESMQKTKATDSMSSTLATNRNIESLMGQMDETFSKRLLRLIDERGMTDSEAYNKAYVDRRHFSKIRKDVNYTPNKKTVLAFAIALELSIDEAKDLLNSAGFAFSRSSKTDIIVAYFLQNKIYDMFEINEILDAYGQPIFE